MTDLNLQAALKTGCGGVVCRRLAAPQGHEYKSAASVSLLLCAAVYAAALTGYRAFSGVMSMQAVLIPLLSVLPLSAPLSLCLYACIVSAVLFCAVWTAAAVCPPPLSSLAAHSIAADTALQNTMVSCNIAFLRFLHFKGGVMITKTFAINYLHLYGVFCNAPCLF